MSQQHTQHLHRLLTVARIYIRSKFKFQIFSKVLSFSAATFTSFSACVEVKKLGVIVNSHVTIVIIIMHRLLALTFSIIITIVSITGTRIKTKITTPTQIQITISHGCGFSNFYSFFFLIYSCAAYAWNGFCVNPFYSMQARHYYCAYTCGLCWMNNNNNFY